jgi:beta-glucosidase-like glycosyl hydrolase
MTIEAGGDLALLCHQFMQADEALAALQDLSPPIVDDALRRIERAKKRFRAPATFSETRLLEVIEALEKLRRDTLGDEAPRHDGDPPSQSPVEDY